MSIPKEYIEYVELLQTRGLIDFCDVYLDTMTEEMVIIPSVLFKEINYDKIDDLFSELPKWWVTEMLPQARLIHRDKNNRFRILNQLVS